MTKARKHFTIRAANQTLHKLLRAGANTYQENVKQRGFYAKLMHRRPRRAA